VLGIDTAGRRVHGLSGFAAARLALRELS